MKVIYYLLPVVVLMGNLLHAQEYNRNSVSLILMDYKDALQKPVYSRFSVLDAGDRYDKNKLQTDLLLYEGGREYKAKNILTGEEELVAPDRTGVLTDYLNQNNVGIQMVAYIYNRQPNGVMNSELFNQRAAYNKTDEDYNLIQATAKSVTGLQEGGEALIENSYIMVYDYANLRYEYVKGDKEEDGDYYWKATPAIYLFRVAWTDELKERFYKECWMDEATPEEQREAIRARFKDFQVPVQFIMFKSTETEVAAGITAFRKKSKEERGNVTEDDLKAAALTEIVRSGFTTLTEKVEGQHEAFRLKTNVFEVKPIRAKIGKKEGVKTDLRFYMYEHMLRKNGAESKVRKGVIRATNKITDNRKVTDGNTTPSEFYQIAGKAAQPGWEMNEKKSLGVNLDLGYQLGNLNGVYLGLTGGSYARKNFNHYFVVDFVYGTDKYEIEWWSKRSGSYVKTVSYNLLVANIGYGYGFMKRNWELYPYIGAGANMLLSDEKKEDNGDSGSGTSSSDKDKEDSKFMDETAWMFNAGVRGTVNICYPIQAFGAVEFSTALSKGKTYNALCIQKDLDKATSGVHFRFGLRCCF